MAALTGLMLFAMFSAFGAAALRTHASPFLQKKEALGIISRQKRANADDEETRLPANLERECLEEVCDYEEAREVFQDSYRTDIFWSVYIDGDQCAGQPCKNGALCSDSVGGYDCICKAGFTGTHCETDQTVCLLDKTKGCSQFCKPGYQSYECSCADGWKLEQKEKCVPAGPFPCGKVSDPKQWDRRKSANIQSEYAGLSCGSEECPWQALLRQGQSGFCSGVVLKANLVLTTAKCATRHPDFRVVVGKTVSSYEAGEQTLQVKNVHVHPLYADGQDENDLAVVELQGPMVLKKSVVPACLPERDFSDSVLLGGDYMGVVTGWKGSSSSAPFEGGLMLNHLSYDQLPVCLQRHPGQVTNKMACTLPRARADCAFGAGSPVLTLHRDVVFLTGVVIQPDGAECQKGYLFLKVSRFLPWLKSFM